jgi:hypothetical protein
MCNLYSITTNQATIIALFRVMNQYVGNLPPMPGVFPDYPAPVVRNAGTVREMVMMRWGMPPPPRAGGFPRIANARAKPIEANKNQSVDGAEGLFLRSGSPQNVYLLPQRQNFRLKRRPRPKQICDHPNNEPDKISHPARASPDSRSTASQIEFATGTRPMRPAMAPPPRPCWPQPLCAKAPGRLPPA